MLSSSFTVMFNANLKVNVVCAKSFDKKSSSSFAHGYLPHQRSEWDLVPCALDCTPFKFEHSTITCIRNRYLTQAVLLCTETLPEVKLLRQFMYKPFFYFTIKRLSIPFFRNEAHADFAWFSTHWPGEVRLITRCYVCCRAARHQGREGRLSSRNCNKAIHIHLVVPIYDGYDLQSQF